MFKITPINDKELQAKYAKDCGAEFIQDFFAYAMVDAESGTLMGFSQFEIEGECGYISDLKEKIGLSDFEAMFILGRATMNFIDMCGAHTCRASKSAGSESLMKAIGFKEREGEELICDMTGMFEGKCSGHAVEI